MSVFLFISIFQVFLFQNNNPQSFFILLSFHIWQMWSFATLTFYPIYKCINSMVIFVCLFLQISYVLKILILFIFLYFTSILIFVVFVYISLCILQVSQFNFNMCLIESYINFSHFFFCNFHIFSIFEFCLQTKFALCILQVCQFIVYICLFHTSYLSLFYTTAIWGLEILHLKVRIFATKVASRQNSVN